MDQSLGYLREILSAHTENDGVGKRIFDRISTHDYPTEGEFVRDLTQEENNYLNRILVEAIEYSNQEQDYERARQLNEVYELLFI
jgi:hypothetical protein